MVLQLNGLVHRTRYIREAACAIALLLLSVQPAFSATKPDGTIEIAGGKEQFMSTLASMPYTSSGAGSALYVLECSKCKSSQAFETDWKGQLDGVELRRFIIALDATSANETAYLARTRDINDFYAFMNRTKVAPPVKACNCPDDNKAIQAFNSVEKPLKTVLLPTIMKNGWPKPGPPPQFMWEANGRVYVGAYSKNSFPEILSMLRAGTQTKETSVPPLRPPSSNSASTINDSSAIETTGQPMSAEKNSPKSVGTGSAGPDVMGLSIGMTPAAARAPFKSLLVSDGLRQSYEELSGTLLFLSPTGSSMPVPRGNYLSEFRARTPTEADGSMQRYWVNFGPIPGQEEIVRLYRGNNFPVSKRPTFAAFEETLFKKYGTPTYMGLKQYTQTRYGWSYDSDGTLQKPGSIKDTSPCTLGANAMLTQGPEDILNPPKSYEKLPAQCGNIYLHMDVTSAGNYAGGETLVSGYDLYIVGYDAMIRASKAAGMIIDKARSDASASAIKKGQQQKPEF